MSPSVPSRLSRRHFDAMAPFLCAALKAYPLAIEVEPIGNSVETFSRKFREARAAKLELGYPLPPDIEPLFSAHASKLQVSMGIGKVTIGTLDAIRDGQLAARVGNSTDTAGTEIEVSREGLLTLCNMLSKGWFKPRPTCFFVRNVDEDEAKDIESRFEVGLMQDENDKEKWNIL